MSASLATSRVRLCGRDAREVGVRNKRERFRPKGSEPSESKQFDGYSQNDLVDDDGGLGNALLLALPDGDLAIHARGQRIKIPLCPVTVRGEEQGFRPTVVLLELEKVGDISDISEQPVRQLATFVFVPWCSPTRELLLLCYIITHAYEYLVM